ncbi:AMP-binding protein [Streptomyces sp. NPDC048282]|uniref:AMP-binding protein n=1 Tax=Streptomyces sp. NPDC048282 TaxID=3365528 RepID=UPI003718C967
MVVAGAPVPPSLIELYAEHGVPLQQAWGLTETAPFATHLPVERTLDKVGSAGIPMPLTEVRVVDTATNRPLRATKRTGLDMVRKRPLPFLPQPLAWIGIQIAPWVLGRADRAGRRAGRSSHPRRTTL